MELNWSSIVLAFTVYRLAEAFALNLTRKIYQGIVDSIGDGTFTRLVANAYKEARIRKYLEEGFELFTLDGRFYSMRIGEPLFIQNIEWVEIEARCPLIPGIITDEDGNYQFVDDQALFPDFNNATRAWKRDFKAKFMMGFEGNELSHSHETTLKVNFGLSVIANLRLHNHCMKDVPGENGNHDCWECVKLNSDSGNWVQGMNMDGVWQPVHVCKEGEHEEDACRSVNINARKRYCDDVHFHLNDVCGVVGCDRQVVQGTFACDIPLHSEAYNRWKAAKKSVRNRLRTYMIEEAKRGRPRIDPTLRTCGGVTLELEQLLRLRADELNDPDLTDEHLKQIIDEIFDACDEGILRSLTEDVQHSFSRTYSFGELFSLHSCGHGVGRTHCVRTEGLHTALMHVLIMTDGGRRRCPTHLFYDRACSLLYYLVDHALPEFVALPRDQWPVLEAEKYTTGGKFKKTFVYDDMARLYFKLRMIVDPFHYNKHSHTDEFLLFCNRFCCPNIDVDTEADPVRRDLVVVDDEGRPVRILNGERQETRAGEDGPFTRMTRNQKFDKAMFMMDTIQVIKNEIHFYKQLLRGLNPRYLVPTYQGPDKWYDLVDDHLNDDNITVEVLNAHLNPPAVE